MPKGGGLSQSTIERINAEVAAERAEREAREALLPPKVGRDPNRPYHPVWNPSREAEQSFLDGLAKERREKLSHSQERHWKTAVKLIKAGNVQSYADLGSRFRKTNYEKAWARDEREDYTAKWAYYLVRKLIVRQIFSEAEIAQLIPDRTSPFNRKKQSTK